MKSLFRSLKSHVMGVLLGLSLVAGLAVAANTVYYGYNPSTGLETFHGTSISAGNLPVLSTTTTSCGTYATVNATLLGGASVFQLTAGATSCTLKFTFSSAAPNGYFCVATDETTTADSMKQTAHDAYSCTLTGTVVVSDNILVEANGF